MNLYFKKKILILAPFTASYSVKLLWFDELSLAPPAGEMKYFLVCLCLAGNPWDCFVTWQPVAGLQYGLPVSIFYVSIFYGHSKVAKTHGMTERGYVGHGEMFFVWLVLEFTIALWGYPLMPICLSLPSSKWWAVTWLMGEKTRTSSNTAGEPV